jgi:adhesin/invasin
MRRLRRAGLALIVILGACITDLSVGPQFASSLIVSPDTPTLAVGQGIQLMAIARDEKGVLFVGLPTTWSTSTPAVATVSLTGMVEAVTAGSAMITATAGGQTATASVTVTPAPIISLSGSTLAFAGTPGAPDPASQSVTVTNTGGGALDNIALGTITYSAGATGWLSAGLDQASAPAILTITVATGSLPIGAHSATVPVTSATASNSPRNLTVQFAVAAGAAATIDANAGDAQSATVNTAVPVPPSVVVRDTYGNPVTGVPVTFAVASGGGNLTGTNPAVTNASGIAQIAWVLGATAGPNSLTAAAAGLTGSPVTFSATSTAGAATTIAASAGTGQSATVNTAVGEAPAVLVTDVLGNPVAGVPVTFAVTAGGGTVAPTTPVLTNGSGIAQATSWALGTTAGSNNNSVAATAGGLSGSPVVFTASATAGAATQLVKSAGDNQSATVNSAVAIAPRVTAQDVFGNPVSGVSVTFVVASGGGSLSGANPTTTDAAGAAQIAWTLGTTAGANGLSASASGLTAVAFTATGTAATATQIVKIAGDGQSAQVGTAVATAPRVQVQDQFGNGVPNIAVLLAITGGAGSLSGTNPALSDGGGFAQIGWTLGNTAGPNSMTASSGALTGSPLSFTATGTAGGATQITASAGTGQSATVNTAVAVAPAVLVRDALGNPVAGVNVTFAVTAGGGTVNPVTPVATNAFGIAQATSWTVGTTAGTGNNAVTATSAGLTGSPVTFTASANAGVPTQLTKTAGDAQNATVNTAVAIAPTVLVRDAFNNPVGGVSITFTVTGGAGTLTGTNPVATNGSGLASIGWTLGSTAGANSLAAAASGLTTVTFNATGTAGAATQIVRTAGDGQSAQVGTAVSTLPRVQVRDASGNGVSGIGVTFAITGGAGSLTGTNPATTDAGGFAQIGWTLGNVAGPNSLTATSGTLAGSPIGFTATATAGAATQIAVNAGNGQSATVNTTVGVPPAVLVTDALGNPVAGVGVTFAVTGGGGGVSPATPVLTNSLGIAQATSWTVGTVAGTNNNTVTGTSAGLTGSPVTFTASASPGTPTQVTKDAGDAQSAAVNTAVAVAPRVLVRDQFNNPVQGIVVTFAVTGGAGSLSGTNPAITDGFGLAQIGWTLGTISGANSLSATVSGVTPVTFTATGTPGSATEIVIDDGDQQGAQVNTAVPTPPRVKARDAFGNGVQGVAITFAVTGGGGVVNPVTPISTDAQGLAQVTSWTLGPTATTNALSATSNPVLANSPLTFTATAFAGTATTIELSVAPNGQGQTDTVGATLPVLYRVRVTDGVNGVGGVPVSWAVTGGGGSITPTSPTTDVNGFVTAIRVLSTTAGAHTATASVGGLTGSPIVFNATALHGTATQIAVNGGNGQSAAVGTAVAVPPSVIVRDQFGNAVDGINVTFTVTNGGGTISPASPATIATNASGIAALASWTLGTTTGTDNNTLSATSAGLTGSPVGFTASATVGAPSAAQSSVTAGSPITACASSCTSPTTASAITVTVRDVFNNPIAGAPVSWSATGSGNTVTSGSGTTDGAGVFNLGRLSSTVAQSKTITAVVNPGPGQVTITQQPPVIVNAAAPNAGTSTLAAGTATIGACSGSCVAGGTASIITATVRDAFGNPVLTGVAVTLSSSGSNNTFSPSASGTTNGSGVFSATFTSTLAEAKVISATGITQTAAVTVIGGAPASIEHNAGDNQSTVVNTAVAVAPAVLVRDQFGNVVQGAAVTFAVTGGGGSVNPVTPVFTNVSGVAQATSWTVGTAVGTNNNTLTASSAGLVGSPVTFTASATVGAPSANQSSVVATSPITACQTSCVTAGVRSTITVTVRDAFNNPISGATVSVASTGSNNALAQPGSLTDAGGVATGTLSSFTAQTKTVSAIVNPGPGQVAVTQQASVVVNPDITSAANSSVVRATATITACQASCVAGSSASTITVTARDQFNNLVANGTAVTIAATGSNNAFSPSASGTTTAGVYAANFTSTLAEAKTISATAGGIAITQTATVTVIGGAAASITLNSVTPQSATVNTTVASPPSVLVRDQFLNVVQGASVTFSISGGGSIVPASPATIGTGVGGTATLTSWTLGTIAGTNNYTVIATTPGVVGNVQFQASGTPGAPSATQTSVAATSPITASSGSSVSTVTVTVRDQFNNPITGASVTIGVTGSGNTVTQPAALTNGSGVTTGSFFSSVAQSKTVSAVVNGAVAVNQQPTVTVNAAVPNTANSTVTRGTATITACSTGCLAGTTASTITVTARDFFNNLVPSAAVTVASSGTGNTFVPASGSTNASGVFTTNFNSTVAQAKTISATAGGVGITQTAAVTVVHAQATQILNNGTPNPQSARVGLTVATDPSVIVRDAFGNNVTGATVTFTPSAGGTTLNGSVTGGTQLTSNGVATVTSWTLGDPADGASGLMANTLTASVSPCSGSCSLNFTGNAFYSWATHVTSILGTGGPCQFCHDVVFSRTPTNNIVGVLATTGTLCDGFVRVIAGNAASSAIYSKANNTPVCGGKMPPGATNLTAAQLKMIRAWINNNALNN